MKEFLTTIILVLNLMFIGECYQWSSSSGSDKVRLTDVSTITLRSNQLTTGRRSSPVPQLQCVGGTAGCHDYLPKTVQCYNRGSDGNDVQWECKAEMDNAYQFGRIQVTCEGYDYPDDPYVLKGSCGLEYELDLTRKGQSGGSYHHQNHHYSSRSGSSFGDIVVLFILVVLGFAIYKSCIAGGRSHGTSPSSYQSSSSSYSGTSSGYYPQHDVNSGTSSGGGFWTGAATGGLLGYMFGRNSRNPGYGTGWGYGGGWGSGYRTRGWGSGYGSRGWGSGYSSGGGWNSGGSRSSRSSGGSRTTSGFGGTSRR